MDGSSHLAPSPISKFASLYTSWLLFVRSIYAVDIFYIFLKPFNWNVFQFSCHSFRGLKCFQAAQEFWNTYRIVFSAGNFITAVAANLNQVPRFPTKTNKKTEKECGERRKRENEGQEWKREQHDPMLTKSTPWRSSLSSPISPTKVYDLKVDPNDLRCSLKLMTSQTFCFFKKILFKDLTSVTCRQLFGEAVSTNQ